MFSFFKKKHSFLSSSLLHSATDWHSHILPGVDDGIQSMEAALDVLMVYEKIGISDVWLTPHVMEDMPNTTDELRTAFEALVSEYARSGTGSLALHLASENMLDSLFVERLAKGDVLPYGYKHDHLLVETSCMQPPVNLYELLNSVHDAGFRPVLAHPERYLYMADEDYAVLHDDYRVKFQMNIPSLVGMYGPEARRRARMLLDAGYYTYMGSDLHNLKKFEAAIVEKVLDSETVGKLECVR